MKENVRVKVDTIHYQQDDQEVFVHEGMGRYFFKRGQHFVEYKVYEDGKEVRYLLKFDEQQLALTKTSEQGRYMMEFWPEGRTKFNYQTPFGIIQVHIHIHDLNIQITENHMDIQAAYDLLSEGEESIKCEMKVSICDDY